MKCFNCNNDINTEASVCSFCGAQINQVKSNFITYIGAPDNLNGYQKSYKLVLLINIIQNFNEKREALVSKVISDIREFYVDRYNRGLLPDVDVDSRISNIHESKDYDVFAVMKSQPYNVINQKGFLFINRNENDELIFVFHDDITASMSNSEFEKLKDLLNQKLTFYFKKHNLDNAETETESPRADTPEQDGLVEIDNYDKIEIINISTLSQRAKNVLMRSGIFTIGELKAFIQVNELDNLKNLGQKTKEEIIDILSSNIVHSAAEVDVDSSTNNSPLIEVAFAENAFNLFVRYCANNNIKTVNDLASFDFSVLKEERGFGETKINKIINKYTQLKDSPIITNVMETIQVKIDENDTLIDEVDYLSVRSKNVLKLNGLYSVNAIRKYATENDIGQLKKITAHNYIEICSLVLMQPISLKMLNDAVGERLVDICISRAKGLSLQEVGEEISLSRERIRQLENQGFKKISPIIVKPIIRSMEINNKKHISEEEICQIVGNEIVVLAIYILQKSGKFEHLDFADIFVEKNNQKQNTFMKLKDLAMSFVGEGINLYDELDNLDKMLADEGYDYIDADAFLNLLIACNAKFYGDYVVFDRQSYGYLCAKVVGKYFKDGINLYSEDDLNLLREYVKKEFGALKLPENNRALASRVDSFLVIVGKGKSNVIENIVVDLNVLEEVKKFIDTDMRSELYYSEIFSEFEGLLCMTTGITNPYCLHGVLSYFYPDNYTYGRDFLTKSGDEYVSVSVEERINELLKTAGHALSRKEIKNKLAGYSDVMIFNAVYRSEYLIQWDANYYNTMNNIDFKGDEREDIGIILDMLVDDNAGYCSDRWIYEEIVSQLPEFCCRNHIENHTNLFYILGAILNKKYKFSQPHIAKYDLFDDLTTKNVAVHFLNDINHISYSEFTEIAEKMHWSPVTSGLVFSELETEYFRISQDEYVKKDIVSFDSQIIDSIKQTIGSKLNEIGYLSLIGLDDFEDFIDVGYEWNTFLLASIVENCEMGFKIVQPQTRDRRYQKGIIIESDSSTDTYDGIVAATMKYHGIESLRENQFLSFLILNHLTTKATPRELQLSDVIKYENETYSV